MKIIQADIEAAKEQAQKHYQTQYDAAEEDRLREASGVLMCAIRHIEHMVAWISKVNGMGVTTPYSLESVGEDMPEIKDSLARIDAILAGEG